MKAMDREPPAFPYDLVFTKCSTLKLFVALSVLLKKNGFYLNSWFLFKYLVSSAQAQVPFPFPLVPGSHADTSIINNASDPSNMPLAGNCSIPHDSGPALGCSCFRRNWLPWRSRYGTLKASPQISFWRQRLWWASSPHSSPDLRDFMGVCRGMCWWGEWDKREDVGTPQSHSPQTLCLWSCSYRWETSGHQQKGSSLSSVWMWRRLGTPDRRRQPGLRTQGEDSVKCWNLLSPLHFQNSDS